MDPPSDGHTAPPAHYTNQRPLAHYSFAVIPPPSRFVSTRLAEPPARLLVSEPARLPVRVPPPQRPNPDPHDSFSCLPCSSFCRRPSGTGHRPPADCCTAQPCARLPSLPCARWPSLPCPVCRTPRIARWRRFLLVCSVLAIWDGRGMH